MVLQIAVADHKAHNVQSQADTDWAPSVVVDGGVTAAVLDDDVDAMMCR